MPLRWRFLIPGLLFQFFSAFSSLGWRNMNPMLAVGGEDPLIRKAGLIAEPQMAEHCEIIEVEIGDVCTYLTVSWRNYRAGRVALSVPLNLCARSSRVPPPVSGANPRKQFRIG